MKIDFDFKKNLKAEPEEKYFKPSAVFNFYDLKCS